MTLIYSYRSQGFYPLAEYLLAGRLLLSRQTMPFDIITLSGDKYDVITLQSDCHVIDVKNALYRDGFVNVETWEFDFIYDGRILEYNELIQQDFNGTLTIVFSKYEKNTLCELRLYYKDKLSSNISFSYINPDYINVKKVYENYTIKHIKKIISEQQAFTVKITDLYLYLNDFVKCDNLIKIEDDCIISETLYNYNTSRIMIITPNGFNRLPLIDSSIVCTNKQYKISRIFNMYPDMFLLNINKESGELFIQIALLNKMNIYTIFIKQYLVYSNVINGNTATIDLINKDKILRNNDDLNWISFTSNPNLSIEVYDKKSLTETTNGITIYLHIHCINKLTRESSVYVDESCTIKKLKKVIEYTLDLKRTVLKIWIKRNKCKIYFKDDDVISDLLNKYDDRFFKILLESHNNCLYSFNDLFLKV